jgi:hypothetical protein
MKFLVALLALVTVSCASAPKFVNVNDVKPDTKTLLAGDYDVLEEYEKVAIAGFKMAFAVQSDVGARVAGGHTLGGGSTSGVSVSMRTHLTGVELAQMQEMTDAAYAKFLADVKKTGREVIAWETIQSHENFKDLDLAKVEEGKPYTAEANGRTYVVLTPKGMPLFFKAGEPLSDQVLGIGNQKALGTIGYKLKAVVVAPTITIDFANTTADKSGSSLIGRSSVEVNTTPELSILGGLVTQMAITTRTNWVPTASVGGVASLKPLKILISNDYGQVTETSATDNKSLNASLAMLFGAGNVINSSKSVRQINVTGEKYKSLVAPAVAKVTEAFANAIAETK